MAIDDYLAPEASIVARLQEPDRLPEGWRVLTAPDVQAVRASRLPDRRVEVVYAGDLSVDAEADGSIVTIEHLWLAVVVIKNVRDLRQGRAARSEAGPVMINVLNALRRRQGQPVWRPAPGWSPLVPRKSGYKATYADGFGYYPLGFATKFQLI